MVDVLKQFPFKTPTENYLFGRVTSVSGIKLTVLTSTGLQISITDRDKAYKVGDKLVLGKTGKLNNLFIIRKVNNLFPSSGRAVIINNGQG